MPQSTERQSENVFPELIIPALAVIFALYYLTTITDVPWIAQASAMVVSGLLFLSVIAFAIRTTCRIKSGQLHLSPGDSIAVLRAHRGVNLKRLVLLILVLLYVALIPWLGFSLATFCLIYFGILLLSDFHAWLRGFIVALLCTTLGYIAFIHIFKIRFPFGPVENFLKGWL